MQKGETVKFLLVKIFDEIYRIWANILGLVIHPYKTMRQIVRARDYYAVLFFLGLLPFWVLSLGIIRGGLELGFFWGGLRFLKLSVAFLGSYILVTAFIYFLGRLFGGRGSYQGVLATWVYSLVPTFLWFGIAAMFYLVLPPPRTTSFLGYLFSVFFVAISLGLFLWKALLYYLTMRFCLKLTFWRIFGVSALVFPIGFLYSLLMYRLGIFRVPFV